MRQRRASDKAHHRPSTSRGLALAALLGLAIAISSCGDDSSGRDAQADDRIPISTTDYGTRPSDVGDPRELNRLANLYATLQRRFQAGDMAGVCAHVSPYLLEQFPPGSDLLKTPCASRLAAYARQLRRKGDPAPRLEIDWLRIYENFNIGGITATDDRGRRLRVPFQPEDGGWKLRLGVFARPDTLNGTIAKTR